MRPETINTLQNKYRINIYGNNLYKEIELPSEAKQVKIGTDLDCTIRMHRDLFFDTIVLIFTQSENGWSVSCSDNLYIDTGDVRKLLTTSLINGTTFSVKYRESENQVFTVEYLLDFEHEKRRYERAIDISAVKSFRIGTNSSCQIQLKSRFVQSDSVVITKTGGELSLAVEKTTYGIYRNGTKVTQSCTIQNGDFFFISDFAFCYKNNILWTEIRDDISIGSLSYEDISIPDNYPAFTRNTRMKLELNKEEIEVLDPPGKPAKPKNNILTALLPSISMLLMSGLMVFMGGTSMIIFSALSGVTAILTTVLGIMQGKKDYKIECKQRIEKYQKYVATKRTEITAYRNQERTALESIYLNQDIEKKMILGFSTDLFDRLPDDDDFLNIRLGLGDTEAERKINYKKQERLEIEDDLQLIPGQIYEEEKILRNAPVVCAFKEANAVGIIGSEILLFFHDEKYYD